MGLLWLCFKRTLFHRKTTQSYSDTKPVFPVQIPSWSRSHSLSPQPPQKAETLSTRCRATVSSQRLLFKQVHSPVFAIFYTYFSSHIAEGYLSITHMANF